MTVGIRPRSHNPNQFYRRTQPSAPPLAQIVCSANKLPIGPRFSACPAIITNLPGCPMARNLSTSRLALAQPPLGHRINPHS